MNRRFQFSLKKPLWVILAVAAASAIACVVVFLWQLQANLGRSYEEYRRAADESRARGKDLSFQEWQRSIEGRGHQPAISGEQSDADRE